MTQWAEIRQMHLVDGIPKKEIARRLGLDIKTVRRALAEEAPPRRRGPRRGRQLDRWRELIESWLAADPKVTAKRIRRLLEPHAGRLPARTVRRYVSQLRQELFPREAFVHRTHGPGRTVEVDFGETWAVVAGELRKVKYLVAVLPCSNLYFAKAYPVERLECLLDGLACAFVFFGGVPERVVLDNTSLAVKRVLRGRDREETEAFHGFRGAYPFHADFCAPGKGWEKGSVERGVRYVRDLVFRPRPEVSSWAELNERILAELEADLDHRHLEDGRTVREAWSAEREHLRPLPAHRPETCRVQARVADKFGHVRVEGVCYSVPLEHAYRPVLAKLYHDRVVLVVAGEVVSVQERSFRVGAKVLDPLHVLPLLERKHRAIDEATAMQQWQMPSIFEDLRAALRGQIRKPDQEWVRVLLLLREHPEARVVAAVAEALERGSPRLATVRQILRQGGVEQAPIPAVPALRPDLEVQLPAPSLQRYDELGRAH